MSSSHRDPGRQGGLLHPHPSLLAPGILLDLYDGAEVVLKPIFGPLADRVGPKTMPVSLSWPP